MQKRPARRQHLRIRRPADPKIPEKDETEPAKEIRAQQLQPRSPVEPHQGQKPTSAIRPQIERRQAKSYHPTRQDRHKITPTKRPNKRQEPSRKLKEALKCRPHLHLYYIKYPSSTPTELYDEYAYGRT
jgi:hypothetical protein